MEVARATLRGRAYHRVGQGPPAPRPGLHSPACIFPQADTSSRKVCQPQGPSHKAKPSVNRAPAPLELRRWASPTAEASPVTTGSRVTEPESSQGLAGGRVPAASPVPAGNGAATALSSSNGTALSGSNGARVGGSGSRNGPQREVRPGEVSLGAVSGVMTDDTVPEGHRGLHGFLYGEEGADVHDLPGKAFNVREGVDEGRAVVQFEEWMEGRESEKPPGVYAVYDTRRQLQYVGMSRNVALALKQHRLRVGEERCAWVRVKVYSKATMVSRSRLEEEQEAWLDEHGTPPGNAEDVGLWEGTGGGAGGAAATTAAMTEAERAEYEEKKLKMRKAMGENLHDEVEGEEEDARARRLRLLQATEGDDWSEVIDGQTKDTLGRARGADKGQQIVSPFARPGAPSVGDNGAAGPTAPPLLDLTAENVDAALEEVRPYLIADGGNVEVVGVEDGIVALRLQGACGTCPSATTTMKMGIERALEEKFGPQLKQVVQVDKAELGATVKAVDEHLDILRPAIHSYGGSVEVMSVDGVKGVCEVKFKGPVPIGMGIQAAIRDKFPDLRVVNLMD